MCQEFVGDLKYLSQAHCSARMIPDVNEKFVDGFGGTKRQRKEGHYVISAAKLMTE